MKRKVLLMGPSDGGKTSMRSVIFSNNRPRDTARLGLTFEMERSKVKFLGNLILNLWDCGGQQSFIENYLNKQKDFIFSNVAVLIYVLDVSSLSAAQEKRVDGIAVPKSANNASNGSASGLNGSQSTKGKTDWDKESVLAYFLDCVVALKKLSPDAKLFCMLHKSDLINQDMKEQVFGARKNDVTSQLVANGIDINIRFFLTSIYGTSLYDAWSCIVNSLIPKVDLLQRQLGGIIRACEGEEAAIFERSTFLCVCRRAPDESDSSGTPTKVGDIIKRFKLACGDDFGFTSMVLATDGFSAHIEPFTDNTLLLFVTKGRPASTEITSMNLKSATKRFTDWLNNSPEAAEMKEVL